MLSEQRFELLKVWVIGVSSYQNSTVSIFSHNNFHLQYGIIEEKSKVTEKEITFLKVQVAKIAKEKEEERSLRINTFNKLQNTMEEKKKADEEHKDEIEQMAEDIKELKSHLVNVTMWVGVSVSFLITSSNLFSTFSLDI